MPTGVHLSNARQLLFDAAERVLRRDGVSGLTSRAVTMEAGVAKGVMHRHFADFDAFLAELVLDRTAQLDGPLTALRAAAGGGAVATNLVSALAAIFSPLAVAIVALVVTRDGLRARLRAAGAARFPLLPSRAGNGRRPLLTEGAAAITAYLGAEQALGRIAATADIATLSHTLIGGAHLLFTDRESGLPAAAALERLVAGLIQGAAPL